MKRNLIILAMLLQTYVYGSSEIVIPDEFTVTKRWFSFTSDFDLQSKDGYVGYVHRKLFSPVLRYDLYDAQGDLLATAKMQCYSWGAVFVVSDSNNQPLGRIEERIVNYFDTFDIINKDGQTEVMAALNFLGTTYTLTDPVTEVAMTYLSRPLLLLKDVWTSRVLAKDVFHNKNIDPRLFMIAVACQSDRDTWRPHLRSREIRELNEELLHGNVQHELELPEVKDAGLTQKDLQSVDAMVDTLLMNCEPDETIVHEDDRIKSGLEQLQPLLEDDVLSPKEKRALELLIQEQSQRVNR